MAKQKSSKRNSNVDIIKEKLSSSKAKMQDGVFIFSNPITINEFSSKINVTPARILTHYFKKGIIKTINTFLDEDDILELCMLYDLDFKKEEEVDTHNLFDKLEIINDPADLFSRPPIVTVMGHVDHGKTTLIDKIRKSNISASEFGGITQHTGAYQVEYYGRKITFLDTPGHEAFTEMRSRGAKITDIVIIVVAADDGVKPQTIEAIDHAKAAGIPIIIFVNKMDKPSADAEKIKSQLSEHNVVCEEWGGDTQFIYGSAAQNQNIDNLLEAVFLQADLLDLKANLNRDPFGTIIESKIDKGRGVVATVIVENGTLLPKDFIIAGGEYGNIRSLMSVDGRPLEKALPGDPCVITGLHKSPLSGDRFIVISDEKFAKKLAEEKSFINKQKELSARSAFSLKDGKKTLNIIIKTDVQGTAEAIKNAISKIKNDELSINVIRATAGELTKSDLLLAETSNSRIYLFNINASSEIKKMAETKQIKISAHNIIYKIVEEIEAIINTLKEPVYEEKQIGLAKVIKLFYYSKVGVIAGCKMLEGNAKEFCKVEVIRKNKSIFKGLITSLRIEKNDVKIVEKGFDFGTHIKDFDKIELDDELKFYEDVLV